MEFDKKTLRRLCFLCESKFKDILLTEEEWLAKWALGGNPSSRDFRRKRTELWLAYLESAGIKVRKSRECFFKFHDVVVFTGFRPRKTYKIGIPFDLAEKILVLGGLP